MFITYNLLSKPLKTQLQCSQNVNQCEKALLIVMALLHYVSCSKVTGFQDSIQNKRYCSKENKTLCIDVSHGNFSTETARDYCSSYNMSLIDLSDQVKGKKLFDILSHGGDMSNYNFALNAGRKSFYGRLWDADGNWYYDKNTKDKAFQAKITFGYFNKNKMEFFLEDVLQENWAICQFKKKLSCQTITTSNINTCLEIFADNLNWFEARQKCHDRGAVLCDNKTLSSEDINKLAKNRGDSSYWIGEWSSFMRFWGKEFSFDRENTFNFTPNWNKNYPESMSTECTFVRVFPNLTYDWGAVDCDQTLEMAVVCQANGSFTLPMESNVDQTEEKSFKIAGYIILGVAIFLLLLLLAFALRKWIKACRENRRKGTQSRGRPNYVEVLISKTKKSSKKSLNSSQKTTETLKYAKLNLPPAEEPEALYSEITDNNNSSAVYTNCPAINFSHYDRETAVGNQTELSQPVGIALKRREIADGAACSVSTGNTIYYNDFLSPMPDAVDKAINNTDSINNSRHSNRSGDVNRYQANSPLMIVENHLYESQKPTNTKAIIINKLKDIGRKISRSGSSNDTTGNTSDMCDAGNGTSPYEPLSPESLGLRSPFFDSGSTPAPMGAGIYSLETVTASLNDDYARLMGTDVAADNK